MIDDINYLFDRCRQKLHGDRTIVKSILHAGRSDLAEALNRYMVGLQDDDLILFNWFIGTTFNISINELRKMK